MPLALRTNGPLRLSPNTLYSAIKRVPENELIEQFEERPYYRITSLGRKVARADARATGLVPKRL